MSGKPFDLSTFVEVGDCHEWTGVYEHGKRAKRPVINARSENGSGLRLSVARLVWEQAGKHIPAGHLVYRNCCNDACVNLEHLKCGPRGAQLTRRAQLGLMDHMQSTRASLTRAARNRSTTKNSEQKAQAVRDLVCEGVRDEDISELTGVSPAMVADIRRGKAWAPSVGAASVFSWRPAA